MVDFDLLIAYFVFIFSIVLTIEFVLGLITPYSNSITQTSIEKDTVTLEGIINNVFESSGFEDLCNLSYHNLDNFYLSYEIKGFHAGISDSNFTMPNNTDGALVFYRTHDKLYVMGGSNSTEYDVQIDLMLPEPVSTTENSLEATDSVSLTQDDYKNEVVSITMNFENNDFDEVAINTGEDRVLITMDITGITPNRTYIGNKSFFEDCGSKGIGTRETSFNKPGIMNEKQEEYFINLKGRLWWQR